MIPNLSKFDTLIKDLRAGLIQAIEYGDPEQSGGHLSLLRIRYMATPGGMQYCIKFLTLGMEGSGIYFAAHPEGIKELRDHLLVAIDRYNQKPALTAKSRWIKERVLTLFGV